MFRFITGALGVLATGAILAGTVIATVPAAAATGKAKPVTRHLVGGITVTRFPDGNTLTTAPMHFKFTSGKNSGFGQTQGDCGTSKLWTFASNHTYQLSLIGNPGVVLGNGWAETSTDGVSEIPSFINFSPRGQTYTSGRVGIWPGLFASEAATVGSDATNEGDCLIAVAAPWS